MNNTSKHTDRMTDNSNSDVCESEDGLRMASPSLEHLNQTPVEGTNPTSVLDEVRMTVVDGTVVDGTSDTQERSPTNQRPAEPPGNTLLNKPPEEPSTEVVAESQLDKTHPQEKVDPDRTSFITDKHFQEVETQRSPKHSESNSVELSLKHSWSGNGIIKDKPPEVTTVGDKDSGGCCSMGHEKLFTIITFCISNFCVGIFYSLLGPFFPQEAAKKGASSSVTGLIFGVFELTIILTSPIAGYQISRVGAKFMYICGIMVCGTCAILFGFLDASPDGTVYIVMCFVVRTCEGMGAGAFVTASFAIIAFTFPDNVGATFGTLEFFSGLGFMIGPPVGGALYQLGGFRLPFISGGALVICLGLASIFILPSPKGTPHISGNKLRFVCNPVVLVALMLLVMGAACIGFIDVSLSIRLEEVYNFTPLITGLVFLVGPGIYAFSAPGWGYIADKKPHLAEYAVVFGMTVAGVGFIMMGPAPFLPFPNDWLWLLLVSQACMGIGVGSIIISFQLMNQAARDKGYPDNLDTYGMVSGLFNSFFSVGAFIGPIIAGALNDAMGFAGGAMVFGFGGLACAVIVALYKVVKVKMSSNIQPVDQSKSETTRLLDTSGNSSKKYSLA